MEIRAIAAAITSVELQNRGSIHRAIEFLAFASDPVASRSLSIGPAQLKVVHIARPFLPCPCSDCCVGRAPCGFGLLRRNHYMHALLSHVTELAVAYGSTRVVANAYHKGTRAPDLRLATVYSEVVCRTTSVYKRLFLNRSRTVLLCHGV